jgi:thiamine kinase-like enzyme/predicted metal-dependent phosphoesterase TrpH
MLLELHAHTSRHSKCSIIDPVKLIRQVVDKGLQGVVLTEHHYQWSTDEIAQLRKEAEVANHFLILTGQEIDTDFGHVLVIGADKTIPERTPLDQLRRQFPDAAIIWAHPYRKGRKPKPEELNSPCIDAVEIFSLNQSIRENLSGILEWHKYKFTAVSGSDIHSAEMAGAFPTHFDHYVTNITELVTEIKKGRCRPFYKEIPKAGGSLVVTEITIGTKGSDELRQRIILKKYTDEAKWKNACQSSSITEAVYNNGFKEKTFRVPKIIDRSNDEKLIIEEGQRGKNLFDILTVVNPDSAQKYLVLAAQWLAKFHRLQLKLTSSEGMINKERQRFVNYRNAFTQTNNPHTDIVNKFIDLIQYKEEAIFSGENESFIQMHGDYHPKNIIIGQDRMHDPGTIFVSVIDFDNSVVFVPAFDVGYFLAQCKSQFANHTEVFFEQHESIFLDAYMEIAECNKDTFLPQVRFMQLRANMSIAAFFIKFGKGESKEMTGLINDSVKLYETLT